MTHISNTEEPRATTETAAKAGKIWICKTNIATKKDLKKVELRLNEHPGIIRWSIDRNDHDNVLRVVSRSLELRDLISIVDEAGYSCEELPD